jgi:hypothetical protein
MVKRVSWISLGMVLMLGCSNFNREWEKAAAVKQEGVEGAWVGRWQSDAGHGEGTLKCLLTRQSNGQYQTRFYATYWGFFRFHTQVMLTGKDQGSSIALAGKEDLGWWKGGVYEYAGMVTPTDFSCTYRSKHDEGTFVMKRPGVEVGK